MLGASAGMVALNAEVLGSLSTHMTSLGMAGPVIFCLFLIASGTLPLPGFGMLVVASGALFGFPYGFLLVWPSAVLGAVIAFALGRRMPAKMRSRFPSKLLALQDAVSHGGFTTLLLLRLTPLPFSFSNLFLGSTPGVSATQHATATAVGFLRLALNSYLGTTIARALSGDGSQGGGRVEAAVTICGVLAAVGAVSNVVSKMLARQKELVRQKEHDASLIVASANAPAAPAPAAAPDATAEKAFKAPVRSLRPKRAAKSPKRFATA